MKQLYSAYSADSLYHERAAVLSFEQPVKVFLRRGSVTSVICNQQCTSIRHFGLMKYQRDTNLTYGYITISGTFLISRIVVLIEVIAVPVTDR